MILRVLRYDLTPDRTIGVLLIDGTLAAYTLEDTVRMGLKIPDRTAIPAGVYKVEVTFSPHFQRMLPLLVGVPGFEGIRIHAGNGSLDTSGCLLVGTGRSGSALTESVKALAKVQPLIQAARDRGERVWCSVETLPVPRIPAVGDGSTPPLKIA